MCYKLKIVFLILIVFSIKGIESITGNLQIWPIKKKNKKKKQANKQTNKKKNKAIIKYLNILLKAKLELVCCFSFPFLKVN